jgi:hypothetical protein
MALSKSPYGPQRSRRRDPVIDRKAHKALLREVSKLIHQPVDSLAVRLTVLARLKLDALEAQLIAGDPTVTVADITTLQETFDPYVPKRGIAVELHVVETQDTQTCPACQHKFDLATVRRTLEESQHAAREREALEMAHKKAVSERHGSVSTPAENNAPAGSPAPTNVGPIDGEKRAADLRAKARMSNDDTEPSPVQTPRPNVAPLIGSDSRSISQFQRDVDAAYRGHL